MAKKFGKFLLFSAAAAAACAGVYYSFQNKGKLSSDFDDEDEDYDDFGEDLEDGENRSYVALTHDGESTDEGAETKSFQKLSSIVTDTADKAEEKVEEFFDEDDPDEV